MRWLDTTGPIPRIKSTNTSSGVTCPYIFEKLVLLAEFTSSAYGPQPHPPPQQPPPNGGGGLIEVSISLEPPLITDAKTDMARLAGCSQLGQSAPTALMD